MWTESSSVILANLVNISATIPEIYIILPMGLLFWCALYSRVSPDTIDFRFQFSAESPALLSVAHTVSAECVT